MTQIYQLDPRTLTITTPTGDTIQCASLAELMTTHSRLETAARPMQPGNRKAERRMEREQAGVGR